MPLMAKKSPLADELNVIRQGLFLISMKLPDSHPVFRCQVHGVAALNPIGFIESGLVLRRHIGP